MAIASRGATGVTAQGASNSTSVTLPVDVQTGDLMLAVSSYSGVTETLTTPSGWTVVSGPIDKGTAMRQYLLSKIATGTDASSTVSFAWTGNTAVRNTEVAIYSGTHATTPVHASASRVEATAGTTHASPTVNVTVGNCWLVEFCADRASPSSTSLTPPSGMTTRDTRSATGGGSITSAVADSGATVLTGTQGGDTWTGTVSSANAILWTVAIAPSSGTGGTATPDFTAGTATVNTPAVLTALGANPTPAAVTATTVVQPLIATVNATMQPDANPVPATVLTPTVSTALSARALPAQVATDPVLIGVPTVTTTSAVTVIPGVILRPAAVNPAAPGVPGSATATPLAIPVTALVQPPVLRASRVVPATAVQAVAVVNTPTIRTPAPPVWRVWNGTIEAVLTVVGVWDGSTLLTAANVEILKLG